MPWRAFVGFSEDGAPVVGGVSLGIAGEVMPRGVHPLVLSCVRVEEAQVLQALLVLVARVVDVHLATLPLHLQHAHWLAEINIQVHESWAYLSIYIYIYIYTHKYIYIYIYIYINIYI